MSKKNKNKWKTYQSGGSSYYVRGSSRRTVKTQRNVKDTDMPAVISERAQVQAKYLCRLYPNLEWFGYVAYTIEDGGYVYVREIYPVSVGQTAYVEMKKEDLLESKPKIVSDVLEKYGESIKLGIIHSHNNMGVTPSGTDYDEVRTNSDSFGMLSIITNNDGEFHVFAGIKRKSRFFGIAEKETVDFVEFNVLYEVNDDKFMEYVENMKQNTYTAGYGKRSYGYGTGYYDDYYDNYPSGSYSTGKGYYGYDASKEKKTVKDDEESALGLIILELIEASGGSLTDYVDKINEILEFVTESSDRAQLKKELTNAFYVYDANQREERILNVLGRYHELKEGIEEYTGFYATEDTDDEDEGYGILLEAFTKIINPKNYQEYVTALSEIREYNVYAYNRLINMYTQSRPADRILALKEYFKEYLNELQAIEQSMFKTTKK